MTMTAGFVFDLLVRSALLAALVLGLVLCVGGWLLRGRAAARQRLLAAGLLVAGLAPVWLGVAREAAPPAAAAGELRARPELDGGIEAWVRTVTPGAAARAGTSGGVVAGLLGLWLAGVAVALLRLGHGLVRARGLVRRARPIEAGLFLSDEVGAAVVVGLARPVILIGPAVAAAPAAMRAQVLAHERAHAARRDPLLGFCERLVTAVYWFHPLVHAVVRASARAREEACDDAALAAADPIDYARTLLALGETPALSAALAVTPPAGALERRIRRLFAPRPAPLPRGRARALVVVAALGLGGGTAALARGLAPAGTAPDLTPVGRWREAPASAEELAIFRRAGDAVEGTFVLRDLSRGDTVVINPALARTRVTPASTFKVVLALAGLEAGVVSGADFLLPWDGRVDPTMTAWNRDHTLASAMATSATWYFQEIERRLDPALLARTVRALGYGSLDSTPGAWLDGSLRISAVEQVEAQARLAAGAVGARARAVIAEVTRLDRQDDATLWGKTGTATSARESVAWLVGQSENGVGRFAYALLLRAPGADSSGMRRERHAITRALLMRAGAWPRVNPGPSSGR